MNGELNKEHKNSRIIEIGLKGIEQGCQTARQVMILLLIN
jgi:hypothetical protein